MRKGDFIQTYSGRKFWPLDPQPDEVHIEDIAHALSNICRFNGHVRQFYSVAEHSVFVALNTPIEHRLAALLHDATEAYLCDLPRPVKHCVVGYAEAEHRVWLAVAQRFGLSEELPGIVKVNDNRILLDEREQFMHPTKDDWGLNCKPLGANLRGWLPREAEAAFLETFWTLGEQVRVA